MQRIFVGGTRAFAAAAVLATAACGHAPKPQAPPAVVVALPVHPDADARNGGSGTVRYPVEVTARYSNAMSFRVPGKLIKRNVRLGDAVKEGQILAQLDPVDAQKQFASAKAALDAAEHRLLYAQQQLDRDKAQSEANLIAANQLEQTQDSYTAALAGRDQASAQLVVARNNLEYNTLVADHAGVITSENADTGQVVAAGQAVYGLAWNGDTDVILDAAESDLGRIAMGQTAKVDFPALPGRQFEARVREIAPAADPQSRTFRVKLQMTGPLDAVRLGMTGDATLLPSSAGMTAGNTAARSAGASDTPNVSANGAARSAGASDTPNVSANGAARSAGASDTPNVSANGAARSASAPNAPRAAANGPNTASGHRSAANSADATRTNTTTPNTAAQSAGAPNAPSATANGPNTASGNRAAANSADATRTNTTAPNTAAARSAGAPNAPSAAANGATPSHAGSTPPAAVANAVPQQLTFTLPATAIFHQDNSPAVWVVTGNDSTLQLRPVKVSSYTDHTSLVTAGLNDGDVVVLAGVHTVYAGQHVKPVRPLFDGEGNIDGPAPATPASASAPNVGSTYSHTTLAPANSAIPAASTAAASAPTASTRETSTPAAPAPAAATREASTAAASAPAASTRETSTPAAPAPAAATRETSTPAPPALAASAPAAPAPGASAPAAATREASTPAASAPKAPPAAAHRPNLPQVATAQSQAAAPSQAGAQ